MITNSMRKLKNTRMMKTNTGFYNMSIDQISVLIWSYMEYQKSGILFEEIDNQDGESLNEFLKLLEFHKLYNEYRLMNCKNGYERTIQAEVLSSTKQELYNEFCAWLDKYFYNSFQAEDFKNILDNRYKDLQNKESLEIMAYFMRKIAKQTGDTNLLKSSVLKKYADNYAKA